MTTDKLKNALAFAKSHEHWGDLRAVLAQALAACMTLAKETERLQAENAELRSRQPIATRIRPEFTIDPDDEKP